jgi:tetrahydromethanopterin S-methyltransferase subunit B
MEFTESRSELIPVQLANGTIIKIEVAQTGEENVAFDVRPFQEVTNAIEGIVDAISSTLQKVKPSKATVKFGLEVAIDSGSLTVLIVKGSSKANLEISLEWVQS